MPLHRRFSVETNDVDRGGSEGHSKASLTSLKPRRHVKKSEKSGGVTEASVLAHVGGGSADQRLARNHIRLGESIGRPIAWMCAGLEVSLI